MARESSHSGNSHSDHLIDYITCTLKYHIVCISYPQRGTPLNIQCNDLPNYMSYNYYHHTAGSEVPYQRCSSGRSHQRTYRISWDLTHCIQHSCGLSRNRPYNRCFLCLASSLWRIARTPSDLHRTFHMNRFCKLSRSIRGPTSPNSDLRDTCHTKRFQRHCNHRIVLSYRQCLHTALCLC